MTKTAYILLRAVRIIAPHSVHHGQSKDILIRDGIIEKIADNITGIRAQVIEGEDLCVSIGLLDVGTHVGDPGYEHREDLHSAMRAANAGGFTALATSPNSAPCIHSKSEVLYLKNKAQGQLSDVFPIGAISVDCKGKDLAEMLDMRSVGAIAFSDAKNSIQDSGLMMRALQYASGVGALVMNQPNDAAIAGHGMVHESPMSTQLGMLGIPSIAEEMMLTRDLSLLEYCGGRLHCSNISTAGSVALLRAAKAKGLTVTASVAIANIALDDSVLHDFNSLYKVMPPLREASDIEALKAGLQDGTIDFVSSLHNPQDSEAKNLEFPYSKYGMIGLETALSLSIMHLEGVMSLENIIEKWTTAPRTVLGIDIPQIAEGVAANLCVFEPNTEWIFSESDIFSKSKNTPFVGTQLKGKVRATINNGQIFMRN